MAESTAILVLGMHRSGTSAATGWLQALGVNLGPYLMAEDHPSQPKGYFEHAEIVGIHDELMAAIGSSWDDPRPLPEGWELDHRIRYFRGQLMEIVRRDLMTQPLWGAKDPRLCRLLPLWLAMLDELGVAVRAICVLRHPAEVAQSLALRNGFAAEKSGLLWLRYVLEAERNSRQTLRITARYQDLLRDWQGESQRIVRAFGIRWPRPHYEAAASATDFLEPRLRHHQNVHRELFAPPLRGWIVTAYKALTHPDKTNEDGEAILDRVHQKLAPYDSYAGACWPERTRDIESEYVQTRAALAQLKLRLAESQSETAQARSDSELSRLKLAQSRDELAQEQSARSNLGAALKQVQSELAAARVELNRKLGELTSSRSELVAARIHLAQKIEAVSKESTHTKES